VFPLDRMLRYCLSKDFQPAAKITRGELEKVILKPTPGGFKLSKESRLREK
jgi:hypothetical protein